MTLDIITSIIKATKESIKFGIIAQIARVAPGFCIICHICKKSGINMIIVSTKSTIPSNRLKRNREKPLFLLPVKLLIIETFLCINDSINTKNIFALI
jgi:hypothetical protein